MAHVLVVAALACPLAVRHPTPQALAANGMPVTAAAGDDHDATTPKSKVRLDFYGVAW